MGWFSSPLLTISRFSPFPPKGKTLCTPLWMMISLLLGSIPDPGGFPAAGHTIGIQWWWHIQDWRPGKPYTIHLIACSSSRSILIRAGYPLNFWDGFGFLLRIRQKNGLIRRFRILAISLKFCINKRIYIYHICSNIIYSVKPILNFCTIEIILLEYYF